MEKLYVIFVAQDEKDIQKTKDEKMLVRFPNGEFIGNFVANQTIR